MKRHTGLALLIAACLLAACASTPRVAVRVDGSTPESYRTSWSKLKAGLSTEQEAQLNTAILLIGTTKLHNAGPAAPQGFGPETLRLDLDGKTFEEIITAGKATGTTFSAVQH